MLEIGEYWVSKVYESNTRSHGHLMRKASSLSSIYVASIAPQFAPNTVSYESAIRELEHIAGVMNELVLKEE